VWKVFRKHRPWHHADPRAGPDLGTQSDCRSGYLSPGQIISGPDPQVSRLGCINRQQPGRPASAARHRAQLARISAGRL